MVPDGGWVAFASTVALTICWTVWRRWIQPLVPKIGVGKARTVKVCGIGTEIPNRHMSHVQGRESQFAFEIVEGEMTVTGSSLSMSCRLKNCHTDGSTATARLTGAGVVLGVYAYVIYTTTEDPPDTGEWTGCGIIRMTASGRALGWWVTEDIYQPGFFQSGVARFWPIGASPDSTETDV